MNAPKHKITEITLDEATILQFMSDDGGSATINDLRKKFMQFVDHKLNYAKADSRVRNGLRRLRRDGVVRKVGTGKYNYPPTRERSK